MIRITACQLCLLTARSSPNAAVLRSFSIGKVNKQVIRILDFRLLFCGINVNPG
jgi:hypothetical protein